MMDATLSIAPVGLLNSSEFADEFGKKAEVYCMATSYGQYGGPHSSTRTPAFQDSSRETWTLRARYKIEMFFSHGFDEFPFTGHVYTLGKLLRVAHDDDNGDSEEARCMNYCLLSTGNTPR